MSIRVCAIAAMDEGRVIGSRGRLPWDLPEDLRHFSALTKGHTVLMGRKTWESLSPRFRPLPGRKNIVVTRSGSLTGAETWSDVEKCVRAYRTGEAEIQGSILWIIGGAEVYKQTVNMWDELFLTYVNGRHEGDAFFPKFEGCLELAEEEKREGFSFRRYRRRAA